MAEKSERVSTGIPGLDPLIRGGLVKGSATLVSGSTGTGKTIFCSQYLWNGLQEGKKCVFVSFEEPVEDIIKDAAVFGWDFKSYIDKEKLLISYRKPFKKEDLFFFEDRIRRFGATRVALDSTSVLSLFYRDEFEIRRNLYKLIGALKATGATSILTAEIVTGRKDRVSRFGVEEFVADGLIILYFMGAGGAEGYRGMQVRKMRRTAQSTDMHPMEISDQGIKIKEI